jgi:hypothetical protein
MGRYSDEAIKRVRRRNYERWLDKAKDRHRDRFDYSLSVADFETQKSPLIRIVCPTHGEFRVSPHDHLRFSGGGCQLCGLSARGSAKKLSHAAAFEMFFQTNLAERLDLLSPYRGAKKSVLVRCRRHGKEAQVTPDRLKNGAIGCPDCIAERSHDALTLKLDDVLAEFDGKFPDHIRITEIQFDGEQSKIRVECERHGTKWVAKGHLTRSNYGCPDCGKEVVGYAGYRLRRLVESGERGQETWIGVMEVEVFGIKALKVGVTTRTLEDRYKWSLKEVFFRARMHEIDALLLENTIHRTFRDNVDLRIMKAGMRDGERWPGDTECYFFREREAIIVFIKQWLAEVENETPDYWRAFEEFERPDYNIRQAGREKDLTHEPQAVVCVETGERFPSISEAARKVKGATQSNISMVLQGKRRVAGGCQWVSADDYDARNIPAPKPRRTGENAYNARPVIRLDSLEEFPTSMEAQRKTGISASKITAVCRGQRLSAGGAKWAYLEDFKRGAVPRRPPKRHGRTKPVIRVEDKKRYSSVSDAAGANGISVSAISNAIRREGTAGGYHWMVEKN